MPRFPTELDPRMSDARTSFAVRFHLLGAVAYEDFLALQRRLVYETGGADDGLITVLLCEHPAVITVGRAGSRGHIRLTNEQLRSHRLQVRWESRGGGCVLHAPGQIAVYPIVPLRWHGWTVGEFLQRCHSAVTATLEQLAVKYQVLGEQGGIWGRSGQLVHWGVAVRRWVTSYGAYINVNPSMSRFGFVDVVEPARLPAGTKSTMGCLFAERRQALSVPKVRATLMPNLAEAFGTERYHLVTGHPWLPSIKRTYRDSQYHAS
jgi:lipoyl(octanoyl) transferase